MENQNSLLGAKGQQQLSQRAREEDTAHRFSEGSSGLRFSRHFSDEQTQISV